MKKQSMIRLLVVTLATVGAISASAQASAQTDYQHAQNQPAAVTQVADLQHAGTADESGAKPRSADAVAHVQNGQSDRGDSTAKCVGPVSFCTLYFGS